MVMLVKEAEVSEVQKIHGRHGWQSFRSWEGARLVPGVGRR